MELDGTYCPDERDFELFETVCREYLSLFGLTDYRVEFTFDEDCDDDIAGWCSASWENGTATLALTAAWNVPVTKERITSAARHEVLELLLWSLYETACTRFTTPQNIDIARHSVIRRLESVLDKLSLPCSPVVGSGAGHED